MHRFFLSPEKTTGKRLILDGGEGHHAVSVLRLREGDSLEVLNGQGVILSCRVSKVFKKAVEIEIESRVEIPPAPVQITLLQAIPRGQIIDDIIEKAVELGVSHVVPLLTDRVSTRLTESDKTRKLAKWQQRAIEACKQCGQSWLPQIHHPYTPETFLAAQPFFDLSLVGAIHPTAISPREVLRDFCPALSKSAPGEALRVAIWIGPEGDFAAHELDRIVSSGARPISLGRLILRCETAAIYCMSIVNYELGSFAPASFNR
jgi:16S rRNA (uracil1498-N3)-methyltransferase